MKTQCLLLAALTALNIQAATYYDSNVRETLAVSNPTFGGLLRGRLSHDIHPQRMDISGEILPQVNLDAVFPEETKLLINAELDFRYKWSQALNILGRLSHFQKSFFNRSSSYLWTEYSAFVQLSPASQYSSWLGYRHRKKALEAIDKLRFGEGNLEFRVRYAFNSRTFLEGTITRSNIIHSDFNAVGVIDDTSLIFLDYPQKDDGIDGLIHLRYWGKSIFGVQLRVGAIESNSVIGGFNFSSFHAYMSGKLGPSTFYHVVFRRVDKEYQYPALEGESRYRDPEEPAQNLTHLRLERELQGGSIGYIQISLLRNETTLNHQYYNKTMIEVGVKHEL